MEGGAPEPAKRQALFEFFKNDVPHGDSNGYDGLQGTYEGDGFGEQGQQWMSNSNGFYSKRSGW